MPKLQTKDNSKTHMSKTPANVDIWMIQRDLSRAPRFEMPAGYRMRFYRQGDADTWLRIQVAAEQFQVPTAQTFEESLGGATDYQAQRIMFLVDPAGKDIGTISAWNDDHFKGREMGRIHWVAIVPEAQGRGLAKPMLSAACDVMRDHGYNEAWLWTSTGRVAAINLYLQFGFAPAPRDDAERAALHELAHLLKYPFG